MNIINILQSIQLNGFGKGFGDVSLSYEWICNIIGWIINSAGDIGLGIILFTLALKLITLPLDIYSRSSMKKNALKMEKMRPELEKLQKQYANNKDLYNQKMMSLYKKEGYSMMSACLPTLVTIVFFFIVFGAFNSYSRFANKDVINNMGVAYSTSLETQTEDGFLIEVKEDTYELNITNVLEELGYTNYFTKIDETDNTNIINFVLNIAEISKDDTILKDYEKLALYFDGDNFNIENKDLQDLINIEVQSYIINEQESLNSTLLDSNVIKKVIVDGEEFYIISDITAYYNASSNEIKQKYFTETTVEDKKVYEINFKAVKDTVESISNTFNEKSEKFVSNETIKVITNKFTEDVVYKQARIASKEAYYKYRSKSVIFFWVENLWVSDNPFNPAVQTYKQFTSTLGNKAGDIGGLTENAYNEITFELKDEKLTGFGKGNGYFVLIVLSIATMLLSTFIMQKSQKTQMELQSVDGANGQAAQTQKMMMWIMPIMFGLFAFMYSSAFSIYMIVSSLYSTISTTTINYFVEKKFRKLIEEQKKLNNNRKGR